jgi:ribosomal silencing factor RsfS
MFVVTPCASTPNATNCCFITVVKTPTCSGYILTLTNSPAKQVADINKEITTRAKALITVFLHRELICIFFKITPSTL